MQTQRTPKTIPEPRKRRSKKKVLLWIGGSLLGLLLAAGIWVLIRIHQPDARLALAARKTWRSLNAYMHQTEAAGGLWDNVWDLVRAEDRHLDAALLMNDGGEDLSLAAAADYSRSQKAFGMSLGLKSVGTEAELALFADETRGQLRSEALLGTDQVQAVPLRNFGRAWNASPMPELTGIQLPEELSLRMFGGEEQEQDRMERAFGERWTAFRGSLRVEKYKKTPCFTGKGKTYTVRWDSDLLLPMYRSANRWVLGVRRTESGKNLLTLGWSDALPYALIYLMGRLDEAGTEPQFFVNDDGWLCGFHAETDTWSVTLSLDGADNPWNRMTLTVDRPASEGASARRTDTLRLSTAAAKGVFRLTAETESSEPKEKGISRVVLSLADGSGRLTLQDGEDKDLLRGCAVSILPKDGGITAAAHRDGGVSGAGLSLRMNALPETETIRPLSSAPELLFDRSADALRAMLVKVRGFSNDTIEPLLRDWKDRLIGRS